MGPNSDIQSKHCRYITTPKTERCRTPKHVTFSSSRLQTCVSSHQNQHLRLQQNFHPPLGCLANCWWEQWADQGRCHPSWVAGQAEAGHSWTLAEGAVLAWDYRRARWSWVVVQVSHWVVGRWDSLLGRRAGQEVDRQGLLPVGNWVLVGEQLLLAGMGPAKYRMYAVLVPLSCDTAFMTWTLSPALPSACWSKGWYMARKYPGDRSCMVTLQSWRGPPHSWGPLVWRKRSTKKNCY